MTVSILSIHQARDSKLKLIKLSAGKEDPVYNLCAKRSARIEIRSDDDDDGFNRLVISLRYMARYKTMIFVLTHLKHPQLHNLKHSSLRFGTRQNIPFLKKHGTISQEKTKYLCFWSKKLTLNNSYSSEAVRNHNLWEIHNIYVELFSN